MRKVIISVFTLLFVFFGFVYAKSPLLAIKFKSVNEQREIFADLKKSFIGDRMYFYFTTGTTSMVTTVGNVGGDRGGR